MEGGFIGETIRRKRMDAGLTQEELCAGLCDPSTLSRIETGKQAPSRNLANALLERLGLPNDRYYALDTFLTSSEAEAAALREKIDSCIVRFQQSTGEEGQQARLDALEHLDRLEAAAKTGDNIARQYILAARAALGNENGPYGFEERLDMLLEAIRLTVPQFDIEALDGRLYSVDETEIISQITGMYSSAGQHEKAAGIFNQLLTYVQDHYQDVTHPSRHLPFAALNYARELYLTGSYEKALKTAELGQKACLDYGFCQSLPDLLAVMANCRCAMGEYGQGRDLYFQAYYLYKETGNARGLAAIEEEAGKQLGLTFPPREGRV